MPAQPSARSRREFLRAGAYATLALPLTTSLATGCEGGYATGPDPLLEPLEAARAEADAAAALAASSGGKQSELAKAVARVRGRHAEVLRAEVARLNRPSPDNDGGETSRARTVAGLVRGLEQARAQAGSLVPSLPRHRAGIAGSVAAGCASLIELAAKAGIVDSGVAVSVRPVSTGELSGEAVGALQQALAAEHAAVWIYGLVTAFLPAAFGAAIAAADTAHRERADAASEVLRGAGANAPPAKAAYRPAEPVTDEASAIRVAVTAETDAARAWRGVLVRTDDMALRTMATRALTGSATRATRWRDEAGTRPTAVALPGKP